MAEVPGSMPTRVKFCVWFSCSEASYANIAILATLRKPGLLQLSKKTCVLGLNFPGGVFFGRSQFFFMQLSL